MAARPGFCGSAMYNSPRRGDCVSFHAMECSRPPPPRSSTLTLSAVGIGRSYGGNHVGPVVPVAPVDPVAPVEPVAPVGPVAGGGAPVGPEREVGAGGGGAPVGAVGPVVPVGAGFGGGGDPVGPVGGLPRSMLWTPCMLGGG